MVERKHGGRRVGAGRPPIPVKRVRVPIRLPPDLRDWVDAEAKRRGVSATAVIEIAIRKLAAGEGVGDGFP